MRYINLYKIFLIVLLNLIFLIACENSTDANGTSSDLTSQSVKPVNTSIPLVVVSESLTTIQAVGLLTPSVVQISTEQLSLGSFNQVIPRSGVGSGIILDTQGHILTNNHVVEGRNSIDVTLSDGRSFEATLVGSDPRTDLAVIKITSESLVPAKLGNSENLLVGEDVIAVGHALALKGGPTVSKGVISALERTIDLDAQTSMVDLIQTDASINPGNSGGPLSNLAGEVIGINTAIIDDSNGIGFAINIDDAKIVSDQLVKKGEVQRGFIGISPFNVTKALKEQLELPVEEGVVIQNFGTQSHPIVRTTKIKSNGITIATNQTADARAIFKGIVMTVLSYKGSNPTVLVQHGNYITAYTNLESVYVKKGQNLGAKEKIGRVFTNPNTGKTELKFSIFQSSTPLNPKGWIYRL